MNHRRTTAPRKPKTRAKPQSIPHVSLTEEEARSMIDAARITFEVPGPPVPCARARVSVRKCKTPDGGERTFAMAYTPETTKAFERKVGLYALDAVNRCRAWRKDAPAYRLDVAVYRDTPRGDWDNFAKACGDAMNGIAYIDDRQVAEAHVVLRLDRKNPRTEVEVIMLDHPAQ